MADKDTLETGDQLHRWRVARGLTAKRLGELIETTERSIHRAERGGRLSARIKVAVKLLATRIASGEITLSPMNKVPERIGRSRYRALVAREPAAKYSREWHGQLSGADIRAWRKSVGLYVKELAELLGVVGPSVMRAERSESPSSRIIYGVELLRSKVLSGELDLRVITGRRVKRGPKKQLTPMSGADIRAWRKSVGLLVKELAELLDVVARTVILAEQSESPSLRIVYKVELLRAQVLSGELDLRVLTQNRAKRGPRRKSDDL